jgi:hypothetical protein
VAGLIRRLLGWAVVPALSLALVATANAGTSTAPAATATPSTTPTGQTSTSTTSSTAPAPTTTTSTSPATTTPTTTTPTTTTPATPPRHRPLPTCTTETATTKPIRHRSCPTPHHKTHHKTAAHHHPRSHDKTAHHKRAAHHKAKPAHHRPATRPAPARHAPSLGLPALPLLFSSGTPEFFIDSFQIPPFLLPIYQAAGIEYDVPWPVLAAINWIETDYGRNLNVSSAGAVGWMQFLPSTWRQWGVDATGSGFADPYNPADAIFAAARYLQAAGAAHDLPGAIFAYNHAGWYVRSVLLRAKLIQSIPAPLLGALSQLVQGRFPVAGPARYRDSTHAYTDIQAGPGAPVVAVSDGRVLRLGRTRALGRYIELRDVAGNVYTYAHLGRVDRAYAVPKPRPVSLRGIERQLALPGPRPRRAASAGNQPRPRRLVRVRPTLAWTAAHAWAGRAGVLTAPVPPPHLHTAASVPVISAAPPVKVRLFAHPWRPASYAAGGQAQVSAGPLSDYLSGALHLLRGQYTLAPLHPGALVVAGTILGHLPEAAPARLRFIIHPAGRRIPAVDPKPILDGWKLLAASAVFARAWSDPAFGPGAGNPSLGQVLLMSKAQLAARVLADAKIRIYACGRRDIQAGLIDRRVLVVLAYLAGSGLDPTVSGLDCGHSATGSTGVDAAGASGQSVDIAAINGTPVLGHQGRGSITDLTIRRLLALQGAYHPAAIVSLMRYPGQADTISLPDHANRIQVSFAPVGRHLISAQALSPGQWRRLIGRLGRLPEPAVPISRSRYAFRVSRRPA